MGFRKHGTGQIIGQDETESTDDWSEQDEQALQDEGED